MNTRQRFTTLTAITAIASLGLTACGGQGEASSDGKVESISILDSYNAQPDKAILQESIDKCAAEIGVKVERTTIPGADRMQTVLQRSSSQTMPDVLMLDNPEVKEIAATGGLTPFSDYGIDTSEFAKNSLAATTYEGEVYGLPLPADSLGLFYNTEILEEAGVEPPETWEELKSAAAKLTTEDQYGLAFSAVASYEGAWQFLPFMWTNGGSETDLDSQAVEEALQLYVDLVDSGSASKSVINWTQADVKDQFVAGKAAMMVNGPWQIPALEQVPEVEWDTVQIPVNEAGQTPVAPLGGMVWTIPETGDEAKKAKAAEFVSCFGSDEIQLSLGEARYTVPTKPGLYDEFVEQVPSMEAFTEQVANARARTAKLGEEWPEAATVIYTAIQLALTGEAPVENAFTRAMNG